MNHSQQFYFTLTFSIVLFIKMNSGSVEAQDALQKFTDFLENEAQQGRISRALEKKVLGKGRSKKKKKWPILIIAALNCYNLAIPILATMHYCLKDLLSSLLAMLN